MIEMRSKFDSNGVYLFFFFFEKQWCLSNHYLIKKRGHMTIS